ncbi:MAG TPA: response regulator [Tepidisphaeraceae bacterium]|jgi:CheY-like chemotaxis protein|nr:response regulator [Tepidisphaeraceae bacterium]
MAFVLVVDDDAESREIVARYLQKAGHRVHGAPNGNKALDALVQQTPDVVILDYKMPELDGISFLEVIRCYLRWQSLPVILLTAYSDGEHIRRAMELGVRKTFLKADFDLRELQAHVEACGAPTPAATPPNASQWPRDSFN